MGHYYGFKPADIGQLTMDQLSYFLRAIPEAQRRTESGSAMIAWLVQRALGGGDTSIDDFYSGYARIPTTEHYEYPIAVDIRKAVRLGILTQDVLNTIGIDGFRHAMAITAQDS